jgi:putative hydroxymethylpyrimidine transport system ATP-binding protein
MLKIIDASLHYKKQALFQHLNLEIGEHEWVVLLGKSGVGKTSLLRMVAGFDRVFPEVDTVVAGAISWRGWADVHLDIAYMAQQDGLFYWLSIIDNVLMPMRLQGQVPDVAKAERLLAQVGLADHRHKKPAALSGGMRQRAALVRTLMQDRPILLMDEPFSALDALTRIEMQNLLFEVFKETKPMLLMVTHDPLEALRIADRIVVLSGVPANVAYNVQLPKAQKLRDLTPELLGIYQEILRALGAP